MVTLCFPAATNPFCLAYLHAASTELVAAVPRVVVDGHAVAVAWHSMTLLLLHVAGGHEDGALAGANANMTPAMAADCAASRHASCRQYAQPKSTTRPMSPNDSVKVMVV